MSASLPVPSHPVAVLKAGLRAALLAAPGLAGALPGGVVETLPDPPPLPCLVFGDAGMRPGPGGSEIRLMLHLLTAERGTARLLGLLAQVEACLGGLALPGLVSLAVARVMVTHDADHARSEARLHLRTYFDCPEE